MKLEQLLPAGALIPRLQVLVKKQALKQLAAHAAEFAPLSEKEIYNTLLEREYVGCTGVGNGVCIPHGRFEGLDKPYAVFARLEETIEFGAVDGKEVDLIFLLLSPLNSDTEHLKALALISKLLRDKTLCAKLRAQADAGELYNLLLAASDG